MLRWKENGASQVSPPLVGNRHSFVFPVIMETGGGQLLRRPEEYYGWRSNQRPPQVGDIGTIVEILHASGLPDGYVVESSGPDDIPIFWGIS